MRMPLKVRTYYWFLQVQLLFLRPFLKGLQWLQREVERWNKHGN